jgi:hypothetical protein
MFMISDAPAAYKSGVLAKPTASPINRELTKAFKRSDCAVKISFQDAGEKLPGKRLG